MASYGKKYKVSKFSSAKKVILKPKVTWTLARRTGAGTISAPSPTASGYSSGRVTTYDTHDLVIATTDTKDYVGMTKKIKHLRCEVARSWLENNDTIHKSLIKMKVYLLYMPQGVGFVDTYDGLTGVAQTLAQHPEWVLSEKTLNCNFKSDSHTVTNQTISCKLSKNLKSGDRIVAVIGTTYNTTLLGSTDMSSHRIPYNLEWTWAQTI